MDLLDRPAPPRDALEAASGPTDVVLRGRRHVVRRHVLLRLLAAVILVLGVSVAAAPAASAAPYVPNGCSAPGFLVAQNALFRPACNAHDICYDFTEARNGEAGRARCDLRFLGAMNGICWNNFWWSSALLGPCYGWANTYFTAVRVFGGPYFNNPNKN